MYRGYHVKLYTKNRNLLFSSEEMRYMIIVDDFKLFGDIDFPSDKTYEWLMKEETDKYLKGKIKK